MSILSTEGLGTEEHGGWGQDFFKQWDFCKSLPPLSLFLGAEIGLLYVGKFCHSCKNHHVNRALDVETCREEKINANLLSKSQLLPAEVRETEQTTLNFKIEVEY